MSTSDQAERYKSQGNAALAGGMFSEAVDLYTKAIHLDPDNSVYFSNRSAAYASLKRFKEALDDANEVVGLRADWVKGHTRRGAALSGLKKHEEARKAYVKAVSLEPGNAQLKELLDQAAAAAKSEGEKDWEQDLWSDDEEEAPAPAPAPAAAAGGKRPAGGGGGSGGGGDAPPPKRKKRAGAQLVHKLQRSLADASVDSLRACLLQLGKGDEAVAEKALHMLEGLNAASSNDEDDDDDGGGGGKGSDSD